MDYKRLWIALLIGNLIYAGSIVVGLVGLAYFAVVLIAPSVVVSLYTVARFSGVERRAWVVVIAVVGLIVLAIGFEVLANEFSVKYMTSLFVPVGAAFAITLRLESWVQIASRVGFVVAIGILGAFIRAPGQGDQDSPVFLVLFIPLFLAVWEQVWDPLLVGRAADATGAQENPERI